MEEGGNHLSFISKKERIMIVSVTSHAQGMKFTVQLKSLKNLPWFVLAQ